MEQRENGCEVYVEEIEKVEEKDEGERYSAEEAQRHRTRETELRVQRVCMPIYIYICVCVCVISLFRGSTAGIVVVRSSVVCVTGEGGCERGKNNRVWCYLLKNCFLNWYYY